MDIRWRTWTDDLLVRARSERRPVLLWITASWCRHCDEMEQLTFGDPEVQRAMERECLPVRVDRDELPHVDALYNQGGWPSTLLLGPHGEVLVGGTFIDAPHLRALLAQAGAVVRGEERPEALGPLHAGARRGGLDDEVLPAIEQALLADFDERHGGFGDGAKFPHFEALDFSILRFAQTADPRLRQILEMTLERITTGQLHDDVAGGFFRYCARRDWTGPHTEKPLETNAGLARNLLEAGQVLGRRDWIERGAETVATLERDFFDDEVGLLHSELAPDDDYYQLDAATRATRKPPPPSRRFTADGNARVVSALLKAGAVLGEPRWTQRGVTLAHTLVRRLWKPGRGMHHSLRDGQRQLPGLLRDQAETARALLHVLQYADDRSVLEPLEDLVEVLAARHVLKGGDFGDAPEVRDTRRKRLRDADILQSAVAAEVMLRAATCLGRPSLHELAAAALERHAGDFRRWGYAMAAYGRSVELVLHPPMHIVVVGPAEDPRTEALLAAASSWYLPSRVVQRLDPEADGGLCDRLGVPRDEVPLAYVFLSRDCAGRHADPVTLRKGLAAANARRLSS